MSYQLGVDIGTTHTAAAVLRRGRAEIVILDDDSALIPSVVFVETDGTVVVGEGASQRGFTDPTRVARAFKRRMGDATPIVLGGTSYSDGELMAKMLRRVVEIVSAREGGPPDLVAVAHPARWGAAHAGLVNQITELAGLEEAHTISDPEAAAHFLEGMETPDGGLVVVYDLGGGTFDVSVNRKSKEGFELVGAPDGIDRLGGIDFDEAVLTHISDAVGIDQDSLDPADPPTAAALARLRLECAAVKEALSSSTEVSVPVFAPGGETEVRLTQDDLEAMIRPALTETIDVLRRTLEAAHVEATEIATVVLVGGSSRLPLVARMVSDELGVPVVLSAEPEHAVALGAALSMVAAAEESSSGHRAASATGSGAAIAASTAKEQTEADDDDVVVDDDSASDHADGAADDDAEGTDEETHGEDEGSGVAAKPTEVVSVPDAWASTMSTALESSSPTDSITGAVTKKEKKERKAKRPAPPRMSLLTSLASIVACLIMIAAGAGAGTLIADGQVGLGVASIVAAVAAGVALALMLRKPSPGSSVAETTGPVEGSSS